ncbi:MAG: CsbD family protein [Oligoflexia bacterium]|nr:CsbD family protein [Oligoflexia bacterium]
MEKEIKDPEVKTPPDEFSKTAAAAKLSGTYNETAGFFKRKFGNLTDDTQLKEDGRNQQLLGKIHHFVGTIRSVREAAVGKLNTTRIDSQAICRKHGGKFLDLASEFVNDIKKLLLK